MEKYTTYGFWLSKQGIREVRTFRGQSRRAGGYGYGPPGKQIPDANYVKNRYYHIHKGEDSLLHEAYLPIKPRSEEIYIDDGVVGNNQGGKRTSQGYSTYNSQDKTITLTTRRVK